MPASVLVVDDEQAIQHALSALLADEGYYVRVASDGAEAWEGIQRVAPDLLLTDVKMPHLDGIALVRRARDQGHAFPVIILSAQAVGLDMLDVHYLAKPFDIDELLTMIDRLLGGAAPDA